MSETPKPGAGSHARIHAVVRRIPRGRVATYGQVAELAGLPGQARLVGYAMAALPAESAIPWHRVINAAGRVSPRAVGPGGTLLVVGHLLGEDRGHGHDHRHEPGALYTAEDVAAELDAGEWDVVTGTRERDPQATERTGNDAPDTVLVARRRAARHGSEA